MNDSLPEAPASVYKGEPAVWGVAMVIGDAADASLNVSLCFFWPLSSGQSLYHNR
jgi:hypothetical protein